MKIQKLKGLAIDVETGIIGFIQSVDVINGKVNVLTEQGLESLDIDNVEFIEEIAEVNGELIYNRDVFALHPDVYENYEVDESKAEDALWELELREDGLLQLHSLKEVDGQLERDKTGEAFGLKSLETILTNALTVVGNMYELELVEDVPTVDFNITIVRRKLENEIVYLYACNNEEKEEIDLIKVVFVGAKLLEEKYSRETISHEEYLVLVENGELVEVSPQELQNYVTGLMYGSTNANDNDEVEDIYDEREDVEDVEEEDEDFDLNCPDCGEDFFGCDC